MKCCSCFRCTLQAYNIIVHLSTPKRYTRLDSDSMERYIIFTRYILLPMIGYRFVKVLLSCRNLCYYGRYGAGEMIIYLGKDNDHYRKSQTLSVCLPLSLSVWLSVSLSLSCLCLSVSQVWVNVNYNPCKIRFSSSLSLSLSVVCCCFIAYASYTLWFVYVIAAVTCCKLSQ